MHEAADDDLRSLYEGSYSRLVSRHGSPGPRDAPGLSPDRVAVVAALRALPSAQRECLALHYLVDLSIADIARTIGVPEGTVKARLSRGRQRLSQLLADEPEWSDHA